MGVKHLSPPGVVSGLYAASVIAALIERCAGIDVGKKFIVVCVNYARALDLFATRRTERLTPDGCDLPRTAHWNATCSLKSDGVPSEIAFEHDGRWRLGPATERSA